MAMGQSVKMKSIKHYGPKETANLGRRLLSMPAKLKQRSDSLQSYSAHVMHELKSEVVLLFRPVSSQFKMDQGYI